MTPQVDIPGPNSGGNGQNWQKLVLSKPEGGGINPDGQKGQNGTNTLWACSEGGLA